MAPALFILLFVLTLQTPEKVGLQAPAEKARANEPAPFALGVLRRDGIVVPFSVFDGKRWSMPWPTDLGADARRVKLGIPPQWWGKTGPLTELTAWANGVNRGPVRVSRAVLLRVMCEWRMGLASDYHSDQPSVPIDVQPYPKDALVISGTERADAIDILSAEAPEWGPTSTSIKDEFDRAEEVAIRHFTDWKNPIPHAVRRSTPVELEAMYRAPMDENGWVAYYVEAVKKYPPGPQDEDCGLVASAAGWMFVGPNGKRFVQLHSNVTYCDRRGVTFMLPLGLVKTQGKSYWAFQLSGYGREGYMVVRPTPKRAEIITHYSAAYCPLF